MKILRTSRSKINSLLCLRAIPQLQPPLGYARSHSVPLTLSHFMRINRPVSLILKINNFLACELFCQDLKKGLCVWKQISGIFSILTPVGCPPFWQLREEGDPCISHNRGVLWLVGLLGEGCRSNSGSKFTAACSETVNQSSSSLSRKGRIDPPYLHTQAVQFRPATLHRDKWSTAFWEFADYRLQSLPK